MEEKEFDFINMIPFIDVMLVLLTIVLMTSTFVVGGIIPIELPRVVAAHEKVMKEQLVEIDNAGAIYYQGKKITLTDLKEKVSSVPRDASFLIRADKNIPLQNFVEVIDTIKTIGFKKISLQTEQIIK
ncbi:MAG: ExbD/TolR family protein [Syntrophorhabdus sp.]|jgi:biopolymer transport protein ExbD